MKTLCVVFGLIVVFTFDPVVAQSKSPKRPNAEERRKAANKSKARDVARLLKEFDKNKDEALDASELPQALNDYLASLDADKDGKLDQTELLKMRGRPGRKAGEIITGAAKGERYEDTLEVGDAAPDFTLADPAGKRKVTLSSFQAKRPVVLIFGSYT